MRLQLSRCHHPVTVLGYGVRAAVWFQGCRIRCTGCISRDTWESDPQRSVDVDEVLAWITSLPADALDGVTFSGGEPFDQPDALRACLTGLDDWRRSTGRLLDLLCYSGYAEAALRSRHASVLHRLDAVMAGPYLAHRPSSDPRYGSANQQVVALTPLGRERYDTVTTPAERRIQVEVDDVSVWYIGIPGPGDMDRLDRLMTGQGVVQQGVSWRT